MEAQLTFGEYMRRLRRSRKWNLTTLSEKTGISYTHLSRLENDSTLPTPEAVASLAVSLDGDLKAMLKMANCLPQVILDRISSSEENTAANSLKRTAGSPGNGSEESGLDLNQDLMARLHGVYGLDEDEIRSVAQAIRGLARLEKSRRSLVINMIVGLAEQEGEGD
jgi:transcriptional regulator with XRE-family HTH domain